MWLVDQRVIRPATKEGTIFNGWSRGAGAYSWWSFHGRRLFRGTSFYRIRTDRDQTYNMEKYTLFSGHFLSLVGHCNMVLTRYSDFLGVKRKGRQLSHYNSVRGFPNVQGLQSVNPKFKNHHRCIWCNLKHSEPPGFRSRCHVHQTKACLFWV